MTQSCIPSTHTSLHVHIIFSTKSRFPHILETWRARLHDYLGGSLRGLGATSLRVGGTVDHVLLLTGLKTTACVADVVREIKKASTKWVHDEGFDQKFGWQEGYGAFAVSRRDLEAVTRYITNQEEHHRLRSFQEEYLAFLAEEGFNYDERYVW